MVIYAVVYELLNIKVHKFTFRFAALNMALGSEILDQSLQLQISINFYSDLLAYFFV